MSSTKTAIRTAFFSIIANTLLALIKGVAGIFGHSFALVADAIESTSDVFASIILLLGFKYAERPADENHPYGHGKIEPLVTFIIVGLLVISAFFIAYQSVKNIQTPHPSPAPWTLIVLGIIILWKELSFRFVMRKSKQLNSSSLNADAWHHRSDAITSVAAFIGIAIALVAGKGYETADDWAALFAAGFILYNSYLILRPAVGEIMDEHFYDELCEEIHTVSQSVSGIINTEKCLIRKVGMKYQVDLHARVNGNISVKQGHDLAHQLKDTLLAQIPSIENVLIHIEPDA